MTGSIVIFVTAFVDMVGPAEAEHRPRRRPGPGHSGTVDRLVVMSPPNPVLRLPF
jgi:hypothetical protein